MRHQHNHDGPQGPTGDLRLAFFLNLSFALLEIVGGLLINSVAILSDALHDLGDSLALGMAWALQRLSGRSHNARFSYGYRRLSLLAALINAVVLVIGSIYILTEAIPRLMQPEPFNATGMIAFAVVGVAVNGFAAYRLRRHKSANAGMVGWHLLEDVLGWAAVLVVGVVALFFDVPILDPILSIAITLFVLFNVARRLWQSTRLFLQAVPEGIDLEEVKARFVAIDGVTSTHHTHIWSLDGERHVLTTHLVVEGAASAADIRRIRQAGTDAVADLDLEHITIAVEFEDEVDELHHTDKPRPDASQPELATGPGV